MEKILIDQDTMTRTAFYVQIKEAKARMRAKERAPGRDKVQKWNLSRHATLQAAYHEATNNKDSDRISIAIKLAFRFLDLEPGNEENMKITRSSRAWAETLKIKAKNVIDKLVKMEIKQQKSDKQRLASIKQSIFDKGIQGVRKVTRENSPNVKL